MFTGGFRRQWTGKRKEVTFKQAQIALVIRCGFVELYMIYSIFRFHLTIMVFLSFNC